MFTISYIYTTSISDIWTTKSILYKLVRFRTISDVLRVESASKCFRRSPLGTNQNIVIGLVPVVVAKLQRLPLPVTLHNEGLSVQQHETTFKTNGYIAFSGELHTTYMYTTWTPTMHVTTPAVCKAMSKSQLIRY